MKKISIFLMMLCLACFGVARADELTVYEEATGTSVYVPVYGYWADAYQKCEFIIPASELSDMTYGTISQMTFYLSTPAGKSWQGTFQVFLKEVGATTINAFTGTSNATVVYTGALDASGSTLSIPFSTTTYSYQGGNLLVGVYETAKGQYSSATFAGQSADGASVQGYSSSSLDAISASQRNFIPKTTFTYTPGEAPSCLAPTLLPAEYIEEDQASFHWTENGSATVWELQYSENENFENAITVNRNGIPAIVIDEFNSATTYYVRVRSNCGDGDLSGWSNVISFTTTCPTFSLPYEYGFENAGELTCWTLINESSANASEYGINAAAKHDGDYGFRFSSYNRDNTSYNQYLISPDFNASNGITFQFYYAASSTSGTETFKVGYSTTTNEISAFTWGEEISTNNTSWTLSEEYNFPAGTKYVALYYYSDYQYRLYVDDFSFSTPSDCKKPTNLVATNVTKNSATLSWTENGEATAWNISVNGTVTENIANPYNLTGLTPATDYTVKVSPVCEDEIWSDEITFTTEVACPAPTALNATNVMPTSVTLNWTSEAGQYNLRYRTTAGDDIIFGDGFENGLGNWTIYTVGESPNADGWGVFNADNLTNGPGNHNGSFVASAWSWSGDAYDADNWLITPLVDLRGTLKFWETTAGSWPDSYEVLLSTTDNNISDFTITLRAMQQATGSWSEVEIDLSSYAGQQGYIAIHHVSNNANYLFIDDFSISTSHEAGQWVELTADANSLDITNLSSETEYEWQVMADCGEEGESTWSDLAIFTTPSACVAPTELNTTDITAASATLSWTGIQENYNVRYGKVFYEGFENGIPSTWTTIDSDGDGNNWFALSEISTLYPNGNYPSLSGWAHNGSDAATSASYINNYGSFDANNWLITPQVDLGGTLEFYVTSTYEDLDSYEVLLSTDGTETTDFTIILQDMTTASNGSWDVVSINLDAYEGQQGYIAIHHVSSNMYFLVVDDFGIYYEMQTTTATESPITINQLDPNSDYAWQVQGLDCDGEGSTTEWSDMATFTTPFGLTREIVGYGTGDGGYCLIASPVEEDITPSASNGFITNAYDLYMFDQTGDGNGNEWINFRPNGSFDIVNGLGYLYASSTTTTLIFTGTPVEGPTHEVSLVKDDDSDFAGMNLVGNPFTEIAYIQDGRPFYTMNGAGTQIVAATSNSIEAMEGVFVLADTDEEAMIFTTEMPAKSAQLALNLSDNNSLVDRAIIRFGESRQLTKFQFNSNSTKLYIPKDNHDYAVVSSEEVGEMPVNFKAQSNGTYTISISAEEIEFGYLHLIDNMTGDDIDLLANPSYSFTANTTDNANRFKLVFATGTLSIEENFAYFNNGSFVINNEGAATMQVIDINGRILSSESINGDANININAAAGVYMIRLVNGDNVRVQKVIVR